jgi:hypothetical protein
MGRPRAKIDMDKVDALLQRQCDGTEIAALLGIHYATLSRHIEREYNVNFADYSQQKKASGHALLRSKMFEMALSGDKTMLIWLSKQYLGMRDQSNITQTIESLPEIVLLPANTANPPVYDEADVVDPLE